MKRIIGMVWLTIALVHGAAGAANANDRSAFDEEYAKQQKVYQTQDEGLLQSYVTDRALSSYALTLPAGFVPSLASLGASDRWLDIGAGQGYAILDYYSPKFDMRYPAVRKKGGKKAKAVAVSIEDRRTLDWKATAASLDPGQLRYFSGKSLREYSLEELGRFQVISDVYGGFSYTAFLSRFISKALELLEVNGSFYTLLQNVRADDHNNKPLYEGSPFLTEITQADGSEVKICSWLRSISCVEVACESKQWQPVIEMYTIRKTCNDVRVPALSPVEYASGTPPWRRFRVEGPTSQATSR